MFAIIQLMAIASSCSRFSSDGPPACCGGAGVSLGNSGLLSGTVGGGVTKAHGSTRLGSLISIDRQLYFYNLEGAPRMSAL